jgi:hypothetical protein
VNYLNAVGIRVRMRTMERAAFYTAWKERKLRGLIGVGPRVAEHTINSIPLSPFAALEDVRLRGP